MEGLAVDTRTGDPWYRAKVERVGTNAGELLGLVVERRPSHPGKVSVTIRVRLWTHHWQMT